MAVSGGDGGGEGGPLSDPEETVGAKLKYNRYAHTEGNYYLRCVDVLQGLTGRWRVGLPILDPVLCSCEVSDSNTLDPLTFAAFRVRFDIVKVLLEVGVDPAYMTRFIDEDTGEVLEERKSRVSELAVLAEEPSGVEGMLEVVKSFLKIREEDSDNDGRAIPFSSFAGRQRIIRFRVRSPGKEKDEL